MKKLFILIIAIALTLELSAPLCRASAELSPPSLSASSAVLMDFDSALPLHAHNAHVRMGMASTTKIMTALTVLRLMDASATVSIPPEAVGIEGSSVYLCAGERMTVEQLLYALLLSSANDAAVALAVCACGSVEAFADQMNAYAYALGLSDTHFTNPHGLHDEQHYTTAYELALIAREALKSEVLRKIFSTYKATIPFDGKESGRLVVNHNKLLRSYEGAIGIKTGYTKATGRCLVSAAVRDGMTLICVTLNAPDDWRDHRALLDFGFENFERRTVADVGEYRLSMPVVGSDGQSVVLTNTQPLVLTLPKGVDLPVSYRAESSYRFLYAPTARHNVCGSVVASVDTQSAISPLSPECSVIRAQKKSFWQRIFGKD